MPPEPGGIPPDPLAPPPLAGSPVHAGVNPRKTANDTVANRADRLAEVAKRLGFTRDSWLGVTRKGTGA